MIDPRLQNQLEGLEKIRRQARFSRTLAIGWFVLALLVAALAFLPRALGWNLVPTGGAILLGALVVALLVWLFEKRKPFNIRDLVNTLEQANPGLHPLLSTAFEQTPDAASGRWGFLQRRVIDSVIRHPQRNVWRAKLNRQRLAAQALLMVALAALVISFSFRHTAERRAKVPWVTESVTVEPGNVEIERGNGLVITARFRDNPPTEADLVIVSATGETKRIPMERHLADPIFGASLREVMASGTYHVEHGGTKTRDYSVEVFEFPALVRADAILRFPEFTGLTNKTIPDTLRVSAVEGSQLSYNFQLNKPVKQARLISKEATLPLTFSSNTVALLNDFVLTNSARYTLQLIDAEGRTNKNPIDVVIQVLPDRVPELKLAFPRGDQRVSNVQELQLQAESTDDFGLVKYGFGFGAAGAEPKLVELGQNVKGNEKRQFNHLIALENLRLQVGEVISYFVWADDYGPDGQVRRTYSDMFFAEVRPYDEIFRADQSGSSGNENRNQQGQGQGGGNQSTRLTELQKQIVIATWKIQREKGGAPSVPQP